MGRNRERCRSSACAGADRFKEIGCCRRSVARLFAKCHRLSDGVCHSRTCGCAAVQPCRMAFSHVPRAQPALGKLHEMRLAVRSSSGSRRCDQAVCSSVPGIGRDGNLGCRVCGGAWTKTRSGIEAGGRLRRTCSCTSGCVLGRDQRFGTCVRLQAQQVRLRATFHLHRP